MSTNKLEDRVLKQIEGLNEGILSSIAKMFMSRKVKSKYKKVYKILKTLCKRNPDHPKCS